MIEGRSGSGIEPPSQPASMPCFSRDSGRGSFVPTCMRQGSALHPGHSQLPAVPERDAWSVPALRGAGGDWGREQVPRKLGRN